MTPTTSVSRKHNCKVARDEVSRKRQKKEPSEVALEAVESEGKSIVRTHSSEAPTRLEEGTFETQNCSLPSTSTSVKTEALETNLPLTDPNAENHELTDPTVENHELTDPTVENHELTGQNCVYDNLSGLTGNRIVDIQHVLRWAFALEKHTKTCENSTIEFVTEARSGFNSTFIFKCNVCDKKFRESNESSEKLNTAFVRGAVTGGSDYAQASTITNVMGIPTITAHKFTKIKKSLRNTCKEQLTEEPTKN